MSSEQSETDQVRRWPLEGDATRTCFARLWKLLGIPATDLWRRHRPGIEGAERQREALELLASVLWHLESAASIAELPRKQWKAPDLLKIQHLAGYLDVQLFARKSDLDRICKTRMAPFIHLRAN